MAGFTWVKVGASKLVSKVSEIVSEVKKTIKDDPRKKFYPGKVGVALILASLFYYIPPLYKSFGEIAMLSMFVVMGTFEFSVGATVGNCYTIGLATSLGGALGLAAHLFANATGNIAEPIIICVLIYFQAGFCSFTRTFPHIKARYDWISTFNVTFCLVAVSAYRTNGIEKLLAHKIFAALIGALISVLVSMVIYPVWAGKDLDECIAKNIDKLGDFLEGIPKLEVTDSVNQSSSQDDLDEVIDSKSKEKSLADFAVFEGYLLLLFRHPWKIYLKIGTLTRKCASRIDALNRYFNSETQAPQEIRGILDEAILSTGKALKELACVVKSSTMPPSLNPCMESLKIASDNLKSLATPSSAVVTVLIDIACIVENIAEAINELIVYEEFIDCSESNGDGENSEEKEEERIGELVMNDVSHVIDIPEVVENEQEGGDRENSDEQNVCEVATDCIPHISLDINEATEIEQQDIRRVSRVGIFVNFESSLLTLYSYLSLFFQRLVA